MSYTNDAAQLTVRMAVESAKVALSAVGKGAKDLTVLIFAALRQHSGTQASLRISQALREGKEMRAFDIRDDDAEMLCRRAKDLGMRYTMLKDMEKDDAYSVILVPSDEAGRFSRFLDRCGIESPFPETEGEKAKGQEREDAGPDLNEFLRRAEQNRAPDNGRNPISGRQDPQSPSAPSCGIMRTAERERRQLPRQERMSVRDFLRKNRTEVDLDLRQRESDKKSLEEAMQYFQSRKEREE